MCEEESTTSWPTIRLERGSYWPLPAGRKLSFEINTSTSDVAEVIRRQLETNLNIEPRVNLMEFSVLWRGQVAGSLPGLALAASSLSYPDPYGFLSAWFTDMAGWHDAAYVSELDQANRTLDPQARMLKLARCEARLLEAMAVIPVSFIPNNYITKPYVRGMKRDLFGDVYFRYAWIDTAWKP
jgi:ABC-type oligopeptide transport system substrate-binding subunit